MSDWTRIDEIDAGAAAAAVQPAIGDVWAKKGPQRHPELAVANVTDIIPFPVKDQKPEPVRRVGLLLADGSHKWMDVGEFRKHYVLRRRA